MNKEKLEINLNKIINTIIEYKPYFFIRLEFPKIMSDEEIESHLLNVFYIITRGKKIGYIYYSFFSKEKGLMYTDIFFDDVLEEKVLKFIKYVKPKRSKKPINIMIFEHFIKKVVFIEIQEDLKKMPSVEHNIIVDKNTDEKIFELPSTTIVLSSYLEKRKNPLRNFICGMSPYFGKKESSELFSKINEVILSPKEEVSEKKKCNLIDFVRVINR